MKTHNGYTEKNGNYIYPDYICNRCRQKIAGGFVSLGAQTHYCTGCYNALTHTAPVGGLFETVNLKP